VFLAKKGDAPALAAKWPRLRDQNLGGLARMKRIGRDLDDRGKNANEVEAPDKP
jgi:hypothetical protein